MTAPLGTPKNILIPIDFSEHSARALAYGVALAERLGARVTALHVEQPAFEYIPLEQAVWGSTVSPELLSKRLRESAENALTAFLHRQPDAPRTDLQHELLMGQPAEMVLDRAEKGGVDLIVVGSHGRQGVARWIMGSVAERIVRHAKCPVLVVH